MTRETTFKAIPPVPRIDDPALTDFCVAIKQRLEVYQGNLGTGSDVILRSGFSGLGELNVNADWEATYGDTEILNKPTLGTASSRNAEDTLTDDGSNLPDGAAIKTYGDAHWSEGSGNVVGPASAVNNRVVFFDGTTGKLIKDSGLTLSGSNTGDQDLTGYVTKALYDTNSILKADIDDTPLALSVTEQTLVGRITAGDIAALTATQVRTLLNVEDGATADQTANEILTALLTVDGTGSGLDADLLDGHDSAYFGTGSGDVVGPASAVNNRVVFFDGTTGKLIKDSGLTLSGSNTGDQTVPDNLTDFIAQTAWRLFYSNNLGDVTELALGTSGQYLKANGVTAAPTWDIPDSMTYPGAGIALSTGSAWDTSIANNSGNWNTAYTERRQWDGGSTNLVATTGRSSLGLSSAALRAAEDILTDGSNLPDGHAVKTYGDAKISDIVYGVGWNGVTTIAPSKNAVYDKIETLGGGSLFTDVGTYITPSNQTGANHPFRIKDIAVDYPSAPFSYGLWWPNAYNLLAYSTTTVPSSLVPALAIYTEGKGDNTNFKGVIGLDVTIRDEPTITANDRGVLYGIRVTALPRFERYNWPYDDVAGICIQNGALGWDVATDNTGTEAVYVGHNPGFGNNYEWRAGFSCDANVHTFLRCIGDMYEGIDLHSGDISSKTALWLGNDQYIRARNNADNGNINLMNVNFNDKVTIGESAPGGIQIGYGATGDNPIALRVGGVNSKTIEVGDVDSGGTGYRMLRVTN